MGQSLSDEQPRRRTHEELSHELVRSRIRDNMDTDDDPLTDHMK
jgi:hypothetical protein